MSWVNFDNESALERDMLSRALPLIPTTSNGSTSVVLNLDGPHMVEVHVSETLGATPEKCIDLLRIRPLLVGAAWKVLDLLLEEAFETAVRSPDKGSRWTIKFKVQLALVGADRPHVITPDLWTALTATYAATDQLRHSLVHRTANVDSTNALIGHDDNGTPLRPLAPQEQEAFVRSALRAAELVTAPGHDQRIADDLTRQLAQLTALHGVALPAISMSDVLPELIVNVDLDPDGTYRLDLPRVRARQPFQVATHVDLTIRFSNSGGREAKGRLENAPDEVVLIDPDDLPAWLT